MWVLGLVPPNKSQILKASYYAIKRANIIRVLEKENQKQKV